MTSSIAKQILEDLISKRKRRVKNYIDDVSQEILTTPQIRGKVLSFDFASLYPTTMKTFSMGTNKSVSRKEKIKDVLNDIDRS